MSEPENFMSRWSRRKRVAEAAPETPAPTGAAAPDASVPEDKPGSNPAFARAPETSAAPESAFDPASLPSLDSIGAQTDIRPFLRAGVPSELRLAALRRAWTMDPAIRDYKGLAENDWDFTVPNSMTGFGEIEPGTDIKKMLAQIFDETPRLDEPVAELPAPQEQLTPPSHELSAPTEHAALNSVRDPEIAKSQRTETAETDEMMQRDKNIASQDDDAEPGDAPIKRRRSQGSALPQ
ncbi:MAG: DUF3306 domain-containing protein [Pseudolabrys sp.]|nr:DUF3306 domain-containing protein [Pseudolabrys sp.]MSP31496.1 DUF3306 domain-containing protein [Pseudolabrys sp.]